MSLFLMQKNRQNELMLTLDTAFFTKSIKDHILSLLKLIHQSLVLVTGSHLLLGLIMSLGLGIGIGLTIFQNPDLSNAYTVQNQVSLANTKHNQSLPLSSIEFKQQSLVIVTPDKQTSANQQNAGVYQPNSGNLGSDQAVMIKLSPTLHDDLAKLNLGSKIMAVGLNNGRYQFTVIEIRVLPKAKINQLLTQNQPSLVLFAAPSFFSKQYLAIVAK